MATGAGFYDANGVYKYGESDSIALYSDFMNVGQTSVSNQFTNDRARISTLESTVSGGQTPNYVLNGAFDFWQRGTSFNGQDYRYGADRWQSVRGAFAAGMTLSRQPAGLTGFQYCLRMARDAGNTGTQNQGVWQAFETVSSIPLAGKIVTLSFYARAGANYSPTNKNLGVLISSGTGTDQPATQMTYAWTGLVNQSTYKQLTTSWARYTYTVTIPSNSTQSGVQFSMDGVGTAGAADYFEITGVQLEAGSYALPFRRQHPSYAAEYAACQRYYEIVDFVAQSTAGLSFQNIYYTQAKRGTTTLTLSNGTITPATANPRATNFFTLDGAPSSNNVVKILASSEL